MKQEIRTFILGGFILGLTSSIGYTIYSIIKKEDEGTDEYVLDDLPQDIEE